MGSDDIKLTETSKKGVRALRDFLAFAETGHLHRARETGREPDSDFEVAVISALKQHGFECVPQVGVAGFYLDIAVRDPGNPNRYLMGIECDGASYHNAKSVRDRDRLRQSVLENLGWCIRRIWSTDWYKNPQAQIQVILQELIQRKTAPPHLVPIAESDIETPATPLAKPTSKPVAETDIIKDIEHHEEQQALAAEEIELEALDLESALRRLDRQVIRTELPDTPDNERLLRPAMLEALLEFRPTTKTGFVELMPPFLRQATRGAEGAYLDQVLRLIEEAENELAESA